MVSTSLADLVVNNRDCLKNSSQKKPPPSDLNSSASGPVAMPLVATPSDDGIRQVGAFIQITPMDITNSERLHTKDNGPLQTEVPTSAYKTHLYLQAKIGYKANQNRTAKPTASPLLAVQDFKNFVVLPPQCLPIDPSSTFSCHFQVGSHHFRFRLTFNWEMKRTIYSQ
ncbi:hypothetical protein B296_00010469 [Ensete ventricosum]|uniref:Uncharacterized protein n=1 Tax=Ensete ventricosum TaxID=4639 RepID=A0A426ZWZ8_ENSVE|nr:hypothetical protein B296_00010469 [Ensete ventricosum]